MQSYQQSKQSPAVSQSQAPQTSARAPKNGRSTTGDPATPSQMNGSDTQHSALAMDDCSGAPEHQNPTAVSLERDVQVVASMQKPVKLTGAARPAESELFTEREASDQSEPGWDYVDTQVGTIEEPFALYEPDPKRMFLDGGPRPDDIQQGQFGDCYFLAALTGIVGKDPSLIEKRMRLGSGTVTVELYRYDSSKADWVLEPITVADSLLHEKTSDGGIGSLLSAQPVAGQDPTQGSWYADVTETELSINADFLYPTARWVALLEKAYAQYVEKYGQYGGATGTGSHENKTTDDQGNALSGYEIMNGGVEEFVYALFYGADVTSQQTTGVAYSPGADLLAPNEYLIWSLLKLNKTQRTESFHMTCSTSPEENAGRLAEELASVLKLPSISSYGSNFKTLLTDLQKLAEAAEGGGEKEVEKLAGKAAWAVKPGNWPVLASDREGGAFRRVQELLLIAAQAGDDSGSGQKFVYAEHAYTVTGSTFLGADGKDAGVTLQNYKTETAKIDPKKSTVSLRNPHGSNEPNPTGKEQTEDGRFSLSLEQFIRAFTTIEVVGVKK